MEKEADILICQLPLFLTFSFYTATTANALNSAIFLHNVALETPVASQIFRNDISFALYSVIGNLL